MEGTTWGVVTELGLVAQPDEMSNGIVMYGSADPAPNPAELILTQLVASRLGMPWRFFVYRHGKNFAKNTESSWYFNPPGVFDLERITPAVNLRELAAEIWNLRHEPVIIAHRPDGRPIRATAKTKDVPSLSIGQLHAEGGWLGGSSIHYILRLYAEEHREVICICPFQTKGRVYQLYQGVGRGLFVLTPFVRIAPPVAPGGWEPLTWSEWRALPEIARRRAYQLIKEQLENFFRDGEPRRIELPWGWWEY